MKSHRDGRVRLPRPVLRKMIADIEASAEEAGYPSGEEWVFDQVRAGARLKDITGPLGVSVPMFYQWMDADGNKERRRRMYAEAKADSVDALVEEGQEILDDPSLREVGTSPGQVQLADKRAQFRVTMARIRNPHLLREGERGTTINIGHLHLDALRSSGAARPQLEGEVLEAEVVEEERHYPEELKFLPGRPGPAEGDESVLEELR